MCLLSTDFVLTSQSSTAASCLGKRQGRMKNLSRCVKKSLSSSCRFTSNYSESPSWLRGAGNYAACYYPRFLSVTMPGVNWSEAIQFWHRLLSGTALWTLTGTLSPRLPFRKRILSDTSERACSYELCCLLMILKHCLKLNIAQACGGMWAVV